MAMAGVQRQFLTESLADEFVARHQAVDVVDQAGKAEGVALLSVLPVDDRSGAVQAVIGHKTDRLARNWQGEVSQALGIEHCAQIADAPMAADICLHQPVGQQLVENAFAVVRQWLAGQVEIGGVVQSCQYLVAAQEGCRDTGFPGMRLQLRPQRALPVRVVGQFGCGAADADIGLPLELHRAVDRRGNLQQHQALTEVIHGLEREGYVGLQMLRQP